MKCYVLFLILFITVRSNAQNNLQNFFKSNSVVFSQDTLDGNTLETLKNRLKDVEIIGLGEQTHYDGATSIARVALIKYLHQKCNFSVIAFESGFYDCYKAYELAKNAKNKDSVLMEPVFGVFRVQEIKPLFEYIAATYQTTNPLKLVGFDHQFASIISKKYFINDFMSFIEKEKIFETYPKDYDKFLKELEKVIYMSNYGRTCSEEIKQIINTYTKIIHQFLDKKSTKNLDDYFWMIICKNIDVEIIHYEKENANVRDIQMATNVSQIKKNLYPNEKMILWGASSHLRFNPQLVEYDYLKNTIPTGENLKKEYKEKYYFLGFTSYEGTWGKGAFSFRVKTPKKADSFEHNLRGFTDKNAFVSLDLADDKLKETCFTANIFGNKPLKMKIFDVADGIIYLRKMTKVHKSR